MSKTPLPWTKCWRNIYEEKAKELGFLCKWHSGLLALCTLENKLILQFKPKSNPFFMEDVIEEAKIILEKKEKEEEEKIRQNEVRYAEYDSRIAAGEPLFIISAQKRAEKERANQYSMLGLLGGLGSLGLGMGWTPYYLRGRSPRF